MSPSKIAVILAKRVWIENEDFVKKSLGERIRDLNQALTFHNDINDPEGWIIDGNDALDKAMEGCGLVNDLMYAIIEDEDIKADLYDILLEYRRKCLDELIAKANDK